MAGKPISWQPGSILSCIQPAMTNVLQGNDKKMEAGSDEEFILVGGRILRGGGGSDLSGGEAEPAG
jgi:hypothetical protein